MWIKNQLISKCESQATKFCYLQEKENKQITQKPDSKSALCHIKLNSKIFPPKHIQNSLLLAKRVTCVFVNVHNVYIKRVYWLNNYKVYWRKINNKVYKKL